MAGVREGPNADDVVSRYQAGVSINQLAKENGVDRSVIYRILRSRNVQLRSQSEAERIKWAGFDSERRAQQVQAANTTRRGQKDSPEVQAKRAATWHARSQHVWPAEVRFANALREAGVSVEYANNVGPYNIDLALNGRPVAVELESSGNNTRPHRRPRYRKRIEHILNAGWSVLIIFDKECPLDMPAAVRETIAFLETVGRNESTVGQYRVIRGNGKPYTGPCFDLDGLPRIDAPEPAKEPT